MTGPVWTERVLAAARSLSDMGRQDLAAVVDTVPEEALDHPASSEALGRIYRRRARLPFLREALQAQTNELVDALERAGDIGVWVWPLNPGGRLSYVFVDAATSQVLGVVDGEAAAN